MRARDRNGRGRRSRVGCGKLAHGAARGWQGSEACEAQSKCPSRTLGLECVGVHRASAERPGGAPARPTGARAALQRPSARGFGARARTRSPARIRVRLGSPRVRGESASRLLRVARQRARRGWRPCWKKSKRRAESERPTFLGLMQPRYRPPRIDCARGRFSRNASAGRSGRRPAGRARGRH
jgi:hypothetical protein